MTLLAAALAALVTAAAGPAAAPAAPAAGPGAPGAETAVAGSESAQLVDARAAALDELGQAVVSYPFTLARFESCVAAVKELRAAARGRPDLAQPLRGLGSGRLTSLERAAGRLESIPDVKAILAKHGLSGRDLLLMPTVIQSSRLAHFAVQGGRPPPADRSNAAALEVIRTEGPRVEKLYQGYAADLAALRKMR
ncbi:MAG: hypothetical protein HZB56_06665 [Deltaproteobacteria bacterium]|nr:hypothetical protein [Deltaproteobacteria bacterium]